MTSRNALVLVIGVSAALRLAAAASLGPFQNEAYYFLYAHHLDWSYFDHPPMVGLVSALGLKVAGWASPILGLRIGFVALFAGSTWLMARLTARAFGAWAGVMAALALNYTTFYGLKVGTLSEPDGPLLFFWLLTIDRLMVAMEDPDRAWPWVGAGAALGAAMLSKYYAILLPAGFMLYLLARPAARRCLRARGPYIATAASLALFAPVIFWNAAHGWASFAFQSKRGGGFQGFQPAMLMEALLAQALFLTPWIMALLVLVAYRLARRGPRAWSDAETFLVCQAAPALTLFLGIATYRRIMPHWPMIGFIALIPMLGRAWAESLAARSARFRRHLAVMAAIPIAIGFLFVAQSRTGLLQDGRGRLLGLVSPAEDPTVDPMRWSQIAAELGRRGLLDDPNSFLFTDSWRYSADLAMATGGNEPVACFHRDARSFTAWSRPEDYVGRDGIYVQADADLVSAHVFAPWFARIEPLEPISIVRAGVPIQQVQLYRCVRQTDAYLFGYKGPGPIPRPVHAAQEARGTSTGSPARTIR